VRYTSTIYWITRDRAGILQGRAAQAFWLANADRIDIDRLIQ